MDNRKILEVVKEVRKVIIGKDEHIIKVMTAILAGGHILLEDIPGVGKTTLALAFSKSMGMKQNRIQFTPDVMPADIAGFSMYNKESGKFEVKMGAVYCNLFLGDEINRTSPKTQSALLEVMEEAAVTIEGHRIPMPQPFIVMATQNPVGSAGTQLLPESQMDRFMVCLSMGYPKIEDEIQIVKTKFLPQQDTEVRAVIDAEELLSLRAEAEQVFVHDQVYDYIGKLIEETRKHDMIALGVSPRGTIALVKMAKAYAYICGRDYVLPEDVGYVFPDVARHRIVLETKARISHVRVEQLIEDLLLRIKKPSVQEK